MRKIPFVVSFFVWPAVVEVTQDRTMTKPGAPPRSSRVLISLAFTIQRNMQMLTQNIIGKQQSSLNATRISTRFKRREQTKTK